MNNSKKKKTIVIILSLFLIVLVILFGYLLIFKKNKQSKEPIYYDDINMVKADYIFTAYNDGQIKLLKTEDKSVSDTIKLDNNSIYERTSNLESVITLSNNTFYKLSEANGKIKKEELFKLTEDKKIKSFKYSSDYIVVLTDNEIIVISLKDKKIEILNQNKIKVTPIEEVTEEKTKPLISMEYEYIQKYNEKTKKYYTVQVFKQYNLDLSNIEHYIIKDGYLVCSKGGILVTLKLDDKSVNTIEIGDITKDFFIQNNELIVFNNFGSGLNKQTIMKIKENDLYINKVYVQDSEKLYTITPDDDDKNIEFIESSLRKGIIAESYYTVDINKEKDNKKRTELIPRQSEERKDYSSENTVATKGYIYSTVNGYLDIFELRGKTIVDIFDGESPNFFMPILK